MKNLYTCSGCGSTDIEGKAWVKLNDNSRVQLMDSSDDEDYYCIDCEEHKTPNVREIYQKDDEVYWTDPDNGASSGIYRVHEKITEDGENSLYLITNGTSEAEVPEHELSFYTIGR